MPAESPHAVVFSGTAAVLYMRAPVEVEHAALALLNDATATFIVQCGSVVINADSALDEVNDSPGFYGLPEPFDCVLRVFEKAIAWAATEGA